MTLHSAAIVLRKYDFSESSQTAAIFTRAHGKVRVIAKGIKKKSRAFEGALDLLDVGTAAWLERRNRQGLCILTEWRQERTFAGLRADLDAYYLGLYLGELTDGLTEDFDPHPALFDGLLQALHRLGEPAGRAAAAAFQVTLLHETGFLPELDECVHCGRPPAPRTAVFFAAGAGGLVCRDCEPHVFDKRQVTWAALAFLRALSAAGDVPAPAEPTRQEIAQLLRGYFSHVLGYEPKTARFAAPRR
jgi:DNA repair protein RecO (recombination protein O)